MVRRYDASGHMLALGCRVDYDEYASLAAELAEAKRELAIAAGPVLLANKMLVERDAASIARISALEAARRTALAYLDCEHPMVCAAIARLHEADSVSETEVCTCDRVTQPGQHFPGCPSFAK